MIQMINVSKFYQMGDETVHALDHANFSVAKGEYVGIVGPSGSGKSTLMNIIGCLDTADEGEYLLEGQEIGNYSETELAHVRNRKIGFIFQDFNLLPQLSAAENVELPLIYKRVAAHERRQMVSDVLDQVGLAQRKSHRPAELSGGQQQRVAIARALVTSPSLFLADEPTGALDSKTSAEILRLFDQLHQQGNTILVITHNEQVADQTERKMQIKDGHVMEATA
ncbi:MAG: ABC transporter ATP-binding protein [Actinomycetia bacterium]|nr:ABC transporter ATP-binding protein [Actinomycetes bacterium]